MRIRVRVGSAVARTPDRQCALCLSVLAVGHRALQQPDEAQRDADVEDVAAECLVRVRVRVRVGVRQTLKMLLPNAWLGLGLG